jgi:hypothetical protein
MMRTSTRGEGRLISVARHGNAGLGAAWRGNARQGKARQGKARQTAGRVNVESAEVTIKGLAPGLLMHRYPLEAIEGLERKSREKQAEHAAYRDGDGVLFIPGEAMQRALVAAAAFSKGKGRSTLAKLTAAGMFVHPTRLSLNTREYAIDSRPCVIPATHGRVVRHRPWLESWDTQFTIEWDEALLTEEQVRRIVDDCGQREGVLDYRPGRKGPFGRFKVTGWKSGKQ